MPNIAPRIRVSRAVTAFQCIDNYLVGIDGSLAARVALSELEPDDLTKVNKSGKLTQNDHQYIEQKSLENPLAKTAGPFFNAEATQLTKAQTLEKFAEWSVPNKLQRKQPSLYQEIDGVGILRVQHTKWDILHTLEEGANIITAFNNTPLDESIVLLDPEKQSDVDLLGQLIRDAAQRQIPVTQDNETFGWDTHNVHGLLPFKGGIRLCQFLFGDSSTAYIVDFGPRTARKSYDKMASMLRNSLVGVELWGQNYAFDMLWLSYVFKVEMGWCKINDSMIWSQIAFSGIKQYRHNLGAICKRLKIPCHDKVLQKSDWGGQLLPDHYNYASGDLFSTRSAIKELQRRGTTIQPCVEQACSLLRVVNHMNLEGCPIDHQLIQDDLTKKKIRRDTLEKELQIELEIEKVASQPVLLAALRRLVDPALESTDAATLRQYQNPIIDKVREYRGLGIAINYGKNILESTLEDTPNRAHTQYTALNPQASGRVASKKFITRKKAPDFGFNALNAAKENTEFEDVGDVRKWFVAPPGKKLVAADLSGSHLRIALTLAGHEDVLEQMETHEDGHAVTTTVIAAEVLGKKHELANLDTYYAARARKDPAAERLRNLSKTAIYLAINMGSGKTLQYTLAKKGISVSLDEADALVKAIMDARIPGVRKLIAYEVKEALRLNPRLVDPAIHIAATRDAALIEERMYSSASMKPIAHVKLYCKTGRWRYLPVYQKVSQYGKIYESVGYAAAAGCIWPPLESFVMIEALIAFYDRWVLGRPHAGIKIWGFIYDELDIEVNEEYAHEAATDLIREINKGWSMLFPGKKGVTGAVEKSIGDSWDRIK